MSDLTGNNYLVAIGDFRRARQQAALESIMARLRGQSVDLLSYDEVRRSLGGVEGTTHKLEDIPLDAIVGSVGRYTDFTRSFLPKKNSDEERWARVKVAVEDMVGVPPIEVYAIDGSYFVRDGNHRVSVARQVGATTIQAYVTPVYGKVPLGVDTQADELGLMAEYADFAAKTKINTLRPNADLTVTAAGRYNDLLEHIQVHRYYMGLEQKREIPYAKAVTDWYDKVYLPVTAIIHDRGLLRDFPDRTETDLYLWIGRHRADLMEELGWEIDPATAVQDLADQHSTKPISRMARMTGRLWEAVQLDELEAGPPAGQWRRDRHIGATRDRIFLDVMVAVTGTERGWSGVEQGIVLAHKEWVRLQGLHVVSTEADMASPEAQAVQARFNQRCQDEKITGQLALDFGPVARVISDRSRLTDLVIVSLNYPPGTQPLERITSGFRTLVRRCPRPILAVPGTVSPLNRPLLAFDGSPKSMEALYLAAYAVGKWDLPLVVVTSQEVGVTDPAVLAKAQTYLDEQKIAATFIQKQGAASTAILDTAEAQGCDFILMGGYGLNPMLEVILGSTVDRVLQESAVPILICR